MKYILHIFLSLFLLLTALIPAVNASRPASLPSAEQPDTVPPDTVPADSIPVDAVPVDSIPADSIPADTIPADSIPVDTIPADTVAYGPGGVPVHPEWPYTMASRTIPLMYINTEEMAPILDKVNYVQAGCFIEVPDSTDRWLPLGDADNPVALEIRGRGNHTWYNLPKKSYKLKFSKKASLLGMPAHKHYALICYDPFYTSMWLAPLVGMQVSRLVQPDWVPRMEPVEVVLNGEYRGLYLLVESIKVDPNRLDITVQEEESEDPATVSSGWVVELDNQDDEFQISIPCGNTKGVLRVTYKEPEALSDMQLQWLTSEFTHLNDLIENPLDHPHERWTDHFDVPSIARYMVIRELLHDLDGYSGSQYFHRDLGSDKWVAGPMWDMEFWPDPKPAWIADYSRWSLLNWIPYMMKSAMLNDCFRQEWTRFYHGNFQQIFDFIDDIEATYLAADLANTARWPEEYYSLDEKLAQVRYNLQYNAAWIDARQVWDYQVSVGVATTPAGTGSAIRGSFPYPVCTAPSGGALLEILSPEGALLLSRRLSEGSHVVDLSAWSAAAGSPILIMRLSAADPQLGMNPTVMKCVMQ
ncbi:MAG: CotH kinase family protein [Muribaculaceae bacterium]|nr:CotH kinase family protein [Muribaculaceae bacterium]